MGNTQGVKAKPKPNKKKPNTAYLLLNKLSAKRSCSALGCAESAVDFSDVFSVLATCAIGKSATLISFTSGG